MAVAALQCVNGLMLCSLYLNGQAVETRPEETSGRATTFRSRRAGWPWRLPARAPTDPDVRTLAHPVPRPTDSPSSMDPEAIRSSDVDMRKEPRCVQHVSLDRVCRPTLRFPPQGPPGRVPLLQRYYQSATTPCCHPAALRFLRLAVPRLHSLLSLPGGRVRRQGLELVTRYLRPGIRRGANRVLPSSWGTTIVRLHMFPSDAGRTACTRPLECSSVAPVRPSAEAPAFRTFDAQ